MLTRRGEAFSEAEVDHLLQEAGGGTNVVLETLLGKILPPQ